MKLKIGLFGFGCVGQGLYHVLNNSTGFKADIVKIAVKNKNKARTVGTELITYDKWEILNNPEIDVVVELIDDADAQTSRATPSNAARSASTRRRSWGNNDVTSTCRQFRS